MPKITYKPEGVEPKVWSISYGKFMSAERIVIERATGLSWGEVKTRLFAEDTSVIRAFLFVLLKRNMPTLKIDQVEFCEDEVELDATHEERGQAIEMYEAKVAAGDITEAQLEVLEELRQEQAEDPDAPKATPVPSTSGSEIDT